MSECNITEIQPYNRPKVAFKIIGVGNTKGWALIKEGKLEAVKISKGVTLVTGTSIKRLIDTSPRNTAE